MIEYPATIHKRELSETATFRWRTNASELHIDGENYPPGTLTLAGFVGTHIGNQRISGAYQFEYGDYDSSRPFELEDLPGIGVTNVSEQDDGD